MNYMKIDEFDMLNGDGIRVSLWVSGCPHRCLGCHNPESWNKDAGEHFSDVTEVYLMDLLGQEHIKGLSVLGGEPLHHNNLDKVYDVIKKAKELYPEKDIWLWTGYNKDMVPIRFFEYLDVLIDGKFEQSNYQPNLKHRGSTNQKVWKVNGSKCLDFEELEGV